MRIKLSSAVVAMIIAAGGVVASASPAAAWSCNEPWSDQSTVQTSIDGTLVNYRSGPSTSCNSFGQWHNYGIYLHCWTSGQGVDNGSGWISYIWWHARRVGTQQQGWVTDHYIVRHYLWAPPSGEHC